MSQATAVNLERQFPCSKCGAKLQFAPGTDSLVCPYCGTHNAIGAPQLAAPLLDYQAYAAETGHQAETHETLLVHCTSCGAETKLGQDVTAGRCAFCGSAVVAEAVSQKLIKPGALLPFIVNKPQANELFHKWISGLWLAPGQLAKRADQAGIDGAYIPAWTYFCDTITQYVGERGDDYTDWETYTEYVNGHMETRTRPVTRTRWTPVSGVVDNHFRDVLVLASRSLPQHQAEHLQPWDLGHLVAYTDEYLSGMACQSYQIDLVGGFEIARQLMNPVIEQTICADIGGNHQRIGNMNPQYRSIAFRHILLPLWISAYTFNGKVYRFLVNARTGAVRGERPYSAGKIAALVAVGVVIISVVIWLVNNSH